MTDSGSLPGLDEEDVAAIAAVWKAPDARLFALAKAGGLNPKTDFMHGDFRGWPLAGEDVRGFDFTGSDLRGTGIERAIRDDSTVLTDVIMDERPGSQRTVSRGGRGGSGRRLAEVRGWNNHWHAGVHQAFGNKLNLILVRFVTASIFIKDSIIRNMEDAGISDFMIFHLYSQWDVLIRVWGDAQALHQLRENFKNNGEINHFRSPHYFEIDEIRHFPDRGKYPSIEEVRAVLVETPTEDLRDAQERAKDSPDFAKLRADGLILDNETFFERRKIQFYVSISSLKTSTPLFRSSLLRVVRESRAIRNRSVYFTVGGETKALIKGQALPTRYYDIHEFLKRLTEELQTTLQIFIETETMLVADQDHRNSSLIDFDRAVRDPGVASSTPASALIAEGEGDRTEFKSTLRMNLHTSQRDPRMEFEVLKTVAAFVNTNGGRLLIGVRDDGTALGIEADKFENEDKMNRHLVSLIRDRMGAQHMGYIRLRFDDHQGKRVLTVDCQRGPAPVFVKDAAFERFFMRTGAATTELSGSQLQEYVRYRFR